ncbi:O-antigen polymerase [Cohnella panacarvi]|uniref:O-antigen polymerase n=1 Tax=Cohnella panacarvi TaxID=400776 RepID=UPI0004793927|nr:O-antigen polymerase [Cohnella panacarvi]
MTKSWVSLISFVVLQIVMVIIYYAAYIPPLVFMWFISVLYIISLPKYLFSPQNMIFAYYFLWYAMAPAFALRFQEYTFTTAAEKSAYLMLFFTYGVSIVFLTFCEAYFESKNKLKSNDHELIKPRKINKVIVISAALILISLFCYIQKTGGISNWIKNPTNAFIDRRGAGGFYLLFLHSLMLFALAYGVLIFKKRSKTLFGIFFLIILLLSVFIGSKSQMMLLIFISIGLFVLNRRLITKWAFWVISTVLAIFTLGIYQRNYTWITLSDFVPYSLNYFNTYEMFVVMLKDYEPSFLQTIPLPLNWILMKFGYHINVPFHDMSIWLTSIYYPQDHAVSGTQQWPIEADLYLSFYYILGIPVLMLYLAWIAYAFYKARTGYLSWILIYTIEFIYIGSHYRGGLFIYRYFWLIPFYILAVFIFRKNKSE